VTELLVTGLPRQLPRSASRCSRVPVWDPFSTAVSEWTVFVAEFSSCGVFRLHFCGLIDRTEVRMESVRRTSGNTMPARAAPPVPQGTAWAVGGKVAERTTRASTQSLAKTFGQLMPFRARPGPVAAVSP
jgi:hypothetical protein